MTHIFIDLLCFYFYKIPFLFHSHFDQWYYTGCVGNNSTKTTGYQDAIELWMERMNIKQKLMQEGVRLCAITLRGKVCLGLYRNKFIMLDSSTAKLLCSYLEL